ncbi:MAG: bifunctional metallophosphatase/5'-nucleotidase [Candidatus Limimorpha sp.]
MKGLIYLMILATLVVSCSRPKSVKENANSTNEVVIFSVNDMHANIDMMPKLAYVVDSLRNIYPDMIVVSAGDNRTGGAYNDKSPIYPNYPMIKMMNEIGFNISELGNHEFDGSIKGLEYVVDSADFVLLCSNADFSEYPKLKENIKPYTKIVKNVGGEDVKITFLGVIETSNNGYPSAHRDSIKDVHFVDAECIINNCDSLRNSCDIFVLVSHRSLNLDTVFASHNSLFDVIIGGHSHDLFLKKYENGVIYTQSKSKVRYATVTKIKVENGAIVSKDAELININNATNVNEKVQRIVDESSSFPVFREVVGTTIAPLSNKKELGALMADAQRYMTGADVALQNPGGVRFDNLDSCVIRRIDVYNLDPFNNSMVTMDMTGRQLADFIAIASTKDYGPLHVSGITYSVEYYIDGDGNEVFINAKPMLENGKPVCAEKVYKVAMNSYMAPWADGMCSNKEDCKLGSNDALFMYLHDHQMLDYRGVSRYSAINIEE